MYSFTYLFILTTFS